MASSIVHLAITEEVAKIISFPDVARLKFGALIPDAGEGGNETGVSHLKVHIQDGRKTVYDFDRYRKLFGEKMLKDGLYLGYYLHLVQDALYRKCVYGRHHWDPTVPGNVERIHMDYRIVNQYIIQKYRLKNDVAVPEGFDIEDINRICSFDTEGLLRKLASYFQPANEEPIFFFTKEMSDEFISEAVDFCVKEIEDLRSGKQGIDMLAYAWDRAGA